MTEFTAADSFFDFDAATDNDLANEVGVEKPKALCSFFRYPTDLHDQRPQPRSAMSFQPTQQVGQRAAIPDSSPTLAPLLSPGMQQQWPALSPRSQYTDTGLFTCGESTPPNQPILHYPQQQQQHEARPQPNVQQQEPASAPASQSMEPIRNTYEQPPARCILHTRMYQQDFGPSSMDPNLRPRPYTHKRPSASSSPITQHQHAPLPLNVESQKLRPNHLLQRPTPLPQSRQRLPAGPSKESPPKTPPAPPPIQPHQQTANHTFPPTPERQQDPPHPLHPATSAISHPHSPHSPHRHQATHQRQQTVHRHHQTPRQNRVQTPRPPTQRSPLDRLGQRDRGAGGAFQHHHVRPQQPPRRRVRSAVGGAVEPAFGQVQGQG
ncbi:hypothetical protein HO173_005065 [Letharia columbiana]|uniref:Uncharacterized protein n=1 Tax=Letharia columbiana TaxID=112416 RepID=A0A8H6FXU3_9LECA|nr:uncharacterized protein HO173_005065 [Letharia columbiana]KAF6236774.1 hypothetical protein HO173_005065 [Letharia columbiana]